MSLAMNNHRNLKTNNQEHCKVIPIRRSNKETLEDQINTPFQVGIFDTKFHGPVYFVAVMALYFVICAGLYLMIFWKWFSDIFRRYKKQRNEVSRYTVPS
jgi:hypothetical protein